MYTQMCYALIESERKEEKSWQMLSLCVTLQAVGGRGAMKSFIVADSNLSADSDKAIRPLYYI